MTTERCLAQDGRPSLHEDHKHFSGPTPPASQWNNQWLGKDPPRPDGFAPPASLFSTAPSNGVGTGLPHSQTAGQPSRPLTGQAVPFGGPLHEDTSFHNRGSSDAPTGAPDILRFQRGFTNGGTPPSHRETTKGPREDRGLPLREPSRRSGWSRSRSREGEKDRWNAAPRRHRFDHVDEEQHPSSSFQRGPGAGTGHRRWDDVPNGVPAPAVPHTPSYYPWSSSSRRKSPSSAVQSGASRDLGPAGRRGYDSTSKDTGPSTFSTSRRDSPSSARSSSRYPTRRDKSAAAPSNVPPPNSYPPKHFHAAGGLVIHTVRAPSPKASPTGGMFVTRLSPSVHRRRDANSGSSKHGGGRASPETVRHPSGWDEARRRGSPVRSTDRHHGARSPSHKGAARQRDIGYARRFNSPQRSGSRHSSHHPYHSRTNDDRSDSDARGRDSRTGGTAAAGGVRGQKRQTRQTNVYPGPSVKRNTAISETLLFRDAQFDQELTALSGETVMSLLKAGEPLCAARFVTDLQDTQTCSSGSEDSTVVTAMRVQNKMPRVWVHTSLQYIQSLWACLRDALLATNLPRVIERCPPCLLLTGLPNVNAAALQRALSNYFKSLRLSLGKLVIPVYPETGFCVGWCIVETGTQWSTVTALIRAPQFQWRGMCTQIRPLPCPQFLQLNAYLAVAPQRSKAQGALNVADWSPAQFNRAASVLYPPMIRLSTSLADSTDTDEQETARAFQASPLGTPTPVMVVTSNRRLKLSVPVSVPTLMAQLPSLLLQRQQSLLHSSVSLPVQLCSMPAAGLSTSEPVNETPTYFRQCPLPAADVTQTVAPPLPSPADSQALHQNVDNDVASATVNTCSETHNLSTVVGHILPPPFLATAAGGVAVPQSFDHDQASVQRAADPAGVTVVSPSACVSNRTYSEGAVAADASLENKSESVMPIEAPNQQSSTDEMQTTTEQCESGNVPNSFSMTDTVPTTAVTPLPLNGISSVVNVENNSEATLCASESDVKPCNGVCVSESPAVAPATSVNQESELTMTDTEPLDSKSLEAAPEDNQSLSVEVSTLVANCSAGASDSCGQEIIMEPPVLDDNGTNCEDSTPLLDDVSCNSNMREALPSEPPLEFERDSVLDGDMDVSQSDDDMALDAPVSARPCPSSSLTTTGCGVTSSETSCTSHSTLAQCWLPDCSEQTSSAVLSSLFPAAALGLAAAGVPSLMARPPSNTASRSTASVLEFPDFPPLKIDGEDAVVKPITREDEFGFLSLFEFGNHSLLALDLLLAFADKLTLSRDQDENSLNSSSVLETVAPWISSFHFETEGLYYFDIRETLFALAPTLQTCLQKTLPQFEELPYILYLSQLPNQKIDDSELKTAITSNVVAMLELPESKRSTELWGPQYYRFAESNRYRGDGFILLPSGTAVSRLAEKFCSRPRSDESAGSSSPERTQSPFKTQFVNVPGLCRPIELRRALVPVKEVDSDLRLIGQILTLWTNCLSYQFFTSKRASASQTTIATVGSSQAPKSFQASDVTRTSDAQCPEDNTTCRVNSLDVGFINPVKNEGPLSMSLSHVLNGVVDVPATDGVVDLRRWLDNLPTLQQLAERMKVSDGVYQESDVFESLRIEEFMGRCDLRHSTCSATHFIETYFFSIEQFFKLLPFSTYLSVLDSVVEEKDTTEQDIAVHSPVKRQLRITSHIEQKLQELCHHTLPNFFIAPEHRADVAYRRAADIVGATEQLIDPATGQPAQENGPITLPDTSSVPTCVGKVLDILVQYVEVNFPVTSPPGDATLGGKRKSQQIVQWLMFENEPDWQATARIPSILCSAPSSTGALLGGPVSQGPAPFELTGDIYSSAAEAKLCCALSCLRYLANLERLIFTTLGVSPEENIASITFLDARKEVAVAEIDPNGSQQLHDEDTLAADNENAEARRLVALDPLPTEWDRELDSGAESGKGTSSVHASINAWAEQQLSVADSDPVDCPSFSTTLWTPTGLRQLQDETKFRFVPLRFTLSTPRHQYLTAQAVQTQFRAQEKHYKWTHHNSLFQPKEEDVIAAGLHRNTTERPPVSKVKRCLSGIILNASATEHPERLPVVNATAV